MPRNDGSDTVVMSPHALMLTTMDVIATFQCEQTSMKTKQKCRRQYRRQFKQCETAANTPVMIGYVLALKHVINSILIQEGLRIIK